MGHLFFRSVTHFLGDLLVHCSRVDTGSALPVPQRLWCGSLARIPVSRPLSPACRVRCLSPPLPVAIPGGAWFRSGGHREESSHSGPARDLQPCFCPSNPDLGSARDGWLQGPGALRSSSETGSFSCSFGCLKPVAYCFPLFFSLFKNSPFFHLEKKLFIRLRSAN